MILQTRNGVTVGGVYTKDDGGRFHFNFKITDVGRSESENQHPRSSEFGSGGRSTASVNVSLTADRTAPIMPSEMANQRNHHVNMPPPHRYCDPTPYTNTAAAIPHLPRPNIPGASSSTSSGRGRKHFQPVSFAVNQMSVQEFILCFLSDTQSATLAGYRSFWFQNSW